MVDTQTRMMGDNIAVMERVTALRELIEASADSHDEATEIDVAVADALTEAGVFKMLAPKSVGGMEVDPQTAIDAIRAISYYDGSTGWYAGAAMMGGAVAGAFMGERAVDAIFGGSGKATCAGQAAPLGKAERVGDGYRISGSFSFGSGSPNAAWIMGGYILHKDGKPVIGENGHPVFLLALAPRDKVEFLGNWDVLGLRGTGSYDYRVLEQVVHEDFTLDASNPLPRRGGTLYRMGFLALPVLTHAAFALGCARRALDEWTEFGRTKKRMPQGHINEAESFQRDLGLAHGDLRAAEAYVRQTFVKLIDAAERGPIPEDLQMDGRLSASHALTTGTRVSQRAFTSCTTTALRNGNRLQRCYRDMQAGMAHFLTGEQSIIDAGRTLAGAQGAPFTL